MIHRPNPAQYWLEVSVSPLRVEYPAPAKARQVAMESPRRSHGCSSAFLAVFKREVWGWLLMICLSLLSYLLVNRYIVTSVVVQGKSMVPTLLEGEHYLLNRMSHHYRLPQRGDVVVLQDPGHQDYAVKRVIAVPGETVHLKNGVVLLNGKKLFEPYLPDKTATYTVDYSEKLILLGDDQYYVMGDNRPLSEDSRLYGPVRRASIIGYINQ